MERYHCLDCMEKEGVASCLHCYETCKSLLKKEGVTITLRNSVNTQTLSETNNAVIQKIVSQFPHAFHLLVKEKNAMSYIKRSFCPEFDPN